MPEHTTYSSVSAMFLDRVKQTPNADAFYYPDANDDWLTMKWSEVGERVRKIASGLRALGIGDEERVAILASTRVDWLLADIGILCAGAATTTIYPSNTPDECAFIITDSGTRIVFAENDEQVAKLVAVREQIPDVLKVVTIDGAPGHDGWVITMRELEEQGATYDTANPDAYEAVIGRIELSWLATLIYTSGTTGRPKGVELLHDCWEFESDAMEQLGFLTSEDKQYLWLPLSHSFGKVLEVASIRIGIPTAIDGRIPKLVSNLAVVRPTFMAAAPRIFEKVYNKVVTGARAGGPVKYGIFKWAVKQGRAMSQAIQAGQTPGPLLRWKFAIADTLVFSKIKATFGGRLRFFISGSAPLSRDMAEFFHAAGVLILEGYGLTESSAASYVNRPDDYKFGTVGKPLPGVTVKLAPEDGEILLGGRGIMRGYRGLDEVNAETLDDRWLRTGDIGEIDAEGYLHITDRKKDLIKTSGGKYVAPSHLESKLKALCPYLSQVVVHGNTRNFCSALVTLDPEGIPKWAEDNDLGGLSYAEITQHPKAIEMVQKAIDNMNKDLARYETVKKFAILDKDLTIEDGLLTASMKVKRKAVETLYKDTLDGFYEGALADV